MLESAGTDGQLDADNGSALLDPTTTDCDGMLDCTVSANNHAELKVSRRLIAHRCASLVPFMRSKDGHSDQWVLKTAAEYNILKDIFHFFQHGFINTDDWLRLQNIFDQSRQWKLKELEKHVMNIFIGGLSEENCVSIWLMCKNSRSDQLTKVSEYLLYVISDIVINDKCLEFLRLDIECVCEILNSDMLNVKDEMDVWKMIKKWIAVDKKRRERQSQSLLNCVRCAFLTQKQKLEVTKELITMKVTWDACSISPSNASGKPRLARDVVLAMCGWEWGGPSSRIEALDLTELKWKRVPSMEDKCKSSYYGCVVIDQKIYTFGGFNGTDCFNTTRCYDGRTGKWTELAPMHFARCYIAGCEVNGLLIAAGGSDGHLRLSTAEMYDPKKNQWTVISSMNQRRSDAAACCLNGKVYIAGGFSGERVLNTVDVYYPENNVWIEAIEMISPRSGLACCAYDDGIILAGGFDGIARLTTVEMLRPTASHTISMPAMPLPRSNFDLCKLGTMVYAVGGFTTRLTRQVLFFDGKEWGFSLELGAGRSALRTVVLKGWPEPTRILQDENENNQNVSVTTAKSSNDQSVIVEPEE